MTLQRIAVIADIHGNARALEAVLDDIARRDVDLCVNLGDLVSGPLWPRETLELLDQMPMPTLRGNHDRWVSGNDPAILGESDRFARQHLTADQLRYLADLPTTLAPAPGVLAIHASPNDDNRYLIERVQHGELARDTPAAIAARLGDVTGRIILCGHSHLPHLLHLPGGPIVLNPGSVGCPAYDDPTEPAHVSEAGSPHARYAVLTLQANEVTVEMIALPYDWMVAAAEAERNGRPEWAHALCTGFMPKG